MAAAFRIRSGTLEDAPSLLPLVGSLHAHEGLPPPTPLVAAALRHLLATPRTGRVLVAQSEPTPGANLEPARPDREPLTGYAVVTYGYSLEFGGRTALLDELFVAAAARREGVGRLLLDAAALAAREAGCHALRLEVERANGAAALYRRSGFVTHTRDVMTRRLGPP